MSAFPFLIKEIGKLKKTLHVILISNLDKKKNLIKYNNVSTLR